LTAVTTTGVRDELDAVEDVALLVALSDASAFAPVLVDDEALAVRRRSRHPRKRSPRVRMPRVRLRMRLPAVRLPRPRRRMRARRYAVQPIMLEGTRRVPVEVLDLTPSSSVDLRLHAPERRSTR
jgi:hypothetical protein